MSTYWRVRLGKAGANADECLAEGFIGVDFDIDQDVVADLGDDWRQFNAMYVPYLLEQDPSRPKVSAGLASAQLWTAAKGIAEGDLVLARDSGDLHHVGVVTGPYSYVSGAELPHRRPVSWTGETLNRADMSEALSASVVSPLTIITLGSYSDELDALRAGKGPEIAVIGGEQVENPLAFAMEAHLEEFLVKNWEHTSLGKEYDILNVDGQQVGQQYPSDTGPIDILARSKDGQTYLVVELKRGRASDAVVGQTLRYMGYVREALAEGNQDVRGVVIALEDDPKLLRALSEVSTVSFLRYRIDFSLQGIVQ
jgi:restriction system protein